MTISNYLRHDLSNDDHKSQLADKQGLIAQSLCKRIRNREFEPGDQLPLYKDLEQEYQVSRATLQHAMNRLKREGFIRTEGRRGAFVADHPPCLFRYGLVLPSAGYETPGLWRAIHEVASRHYQSANGRRIALYQDVQLHVDNEPFQQLMTDVQQHRLAGLIMIGGHGLIFEMDEWFGPTFPGVWFKPNHAPQASTPDGRYYIDFDNAQFRAKALDYLIAQGCKNIAVIGQPFEPHIRPYAHDMAVRNLNVREHWLLRTALEQPQCARDLSRLLFASTDRPDGLIILADNLVEQTMAGIVDAHIRVPEKLKIVAHCNWPLPPTQVLPAQLLGYEAQQILQLSIDIIDRVHLKQPNTSHPLIEARFKHECQWQPATPQQTSAFQR
jgi:DNA-binding LacI/PurR family transcriptional regulator